MIYVKSIFAGTVVVIVCIGLFTLAFSTVNIDLRAIMGVFPVVSLVTMLAVFVVGFLWQFRRTSHDNGTGIPREVLPHIFEPFFTTKGVGEGTGLGLDISMRVVRKHRGEIQVQSKPGGTTFRVSIPKQRTAQS